MRKFLHPGPAAVAALAAWLSIGVLPAFARAAEEVSTEQDVEAARRCAAGTRAAGHAFNEVRDSVRAGGTTRAEALLTVAEDALLNARSACRGNAEVSAQLELLAGDAASLRRSLGSSR